MIIQTILLIVIILAILYGSRTVPENFEINENNIAYKIDKELTFSNKLRVNENGGSLKNNIGEFGTAKKLLNKKSTVVLTYTSRSSEEGILLYIPIYSEDNIGNNINLLFSSERGNCRLKLNILNTSFTYNLGLSNSTYIIAIRLNNLNHTLFVNGIERTPINNKTTKIEKQKYYFVDMPIIINKNKSLKGELHSIIIYKMLLDGDEIEDLYKYTMRDFLYDDSLKYSKQKILDPPTLFKKPIVKADKNSTCNFKRPKGKELCKVCPDIYIDYAHMNVEMSARCEPKVNKYCEANYDEPACNVINTINQANEFK